MHTTQENGSRDMEEHFLLDANKADAKIAGQQVNQPNGPAGPTWPEYSDKTPVYKFLRNVPLLFQ